MFNHAFVNIKLYYKDRKKAVLKKIWLSFSTI